MWSLPTCVPAGGIGRERGTSAHTILSVMRTYRPISGVSKRLVQVTIRATERESRQLQIHLKLRIQHRQLRFTVIGFPIPFNFYSLNSYRPFSHSIYTRHAHHPNPCPTNQLSTRNGLKYFTRFISVPRFFTVSEKF